MRKERELKVLSPTGILGYGFPVESFERGLEKNPDVIGVDAGSTDPGPYYLGSGELLVGADNLKRDLELLLRAGCRRNIPVIIGSAGGAGTGTHVRRVEEIIEEIAREDRLSFRLGTIGADIPKDAVRKGLETGRITPLPSVPDLTHDDVAESTAIVAQMGHEPVIDAVNKGCDVILCGRCYDPVPFSAVPVNAGFDMGLSCHMGKILECAAIAAVPGSGCDCVLGTITEDSFTLETLNKERRFTIASTAAHTLYEKRDPYHLPGPGGTIDLRQARFEALDNGAVRVAGSRYLRSEKHMIKLEGARPVGHRTMSVAGIRDPVLIGRIDEVISAVRQEAETNFHGREDGFELLFHVYGKDGVMGGRETVKESTSHELGLVIEAVGRSRELSQAVCAFARSTFLHFGYPGRLSTAGNLAFLHSPSDVYCGRVYRFSLYHLLEIDDPREFFPIEVKEI